MDKALPKGWVETEFGAINQRSVTKNIEPSNFPEERFELYSVPIFDAGQPEFQLGEDIKSSKQLVKRGDVLVCKINPRINRVWVVDDYSQFRKIASSEWIVIGNELINSLFLKYQFQSKQFRTLLQSEVSGVGGSLTRARPKLVNAYPIFLPPLPEQERIVAKLDKLFTQHEKIKKALDRIPQLIKAFRQQVLTQAVTGKLTENWREGKELEEWRVTALKEVCYGFKYGSSSKSDEEGKVAVLRMGNLQNGKLDLSDLKYSNNEVEIRKYSLEPDDVLFNRTNSPDLVGKTSIYKGEIPAIYAGYLIKIENNKAILNSDYLNFYMNTKQVKVWCSQVKSDGVSQSNINAKKLAELEISLPPSLEQQEIVRRVENLFSKADAIEARYQTLKEKIDSLPQAILHKAFKGELVPQLPTDGDAKDLLAEIMALKKESKGKRGKA